jgi:hypothetical protein
MDSLAIKEAYGVHWDEVWQFVDQDGYCEELNYERTPSDRRNHRKLEDMGVDLSTVDRGMHLYTGNPVWRPKSLAKLEKPLN